MKFKQSALFLTKKLQKCDYPILEIIRNKNDALRCIFKPRTQPDSGQKDKLSPPETSVYYMPNVLTKVKAPVIKANSY
ncbi:MAG: hypothetical protein ACHQIM_07215 [Sphingobacteriales bacterium]